MNARGSVPLLFLATAFAFCACSKPEPEADWGGQIEERDGVVHVRNPATPPPRDTDIPRLELEQVFGVDQAPRDAVISRVAGVAVGPSGDVYVLDSRLPRLVAFSPDGRVRWTSGAEGQGPADLSRPSDIATDGNETLYVVNEERARIDRWTTMGEFIDSHSLVEYGLDGDQLVGMISPSRLVFNGIVVGSAAARIRVLNVDTPWRVESDFTVNVEDAPTGTTAGIPVSVTEREIGVGDFDSYTLRLYDVRGALQRVITREVEVLVGFARAGSRSPDSWLWAPSRFPSGHLLSHASWRELPDRWSSSIDLFDPDGRFVRSLSFDDAQWGDVGRPTVIGPDGKLYTRSSRPFPQVRRFRLIAEE